MENIKSILLNYDNLNRSTECIFDSNIIPIDSIHIVNYIIEPFIVENSISVKINSDNYESEKPKSKK